MINILELEQKSENKDQLVGAFEDHVWFEDRWMVASLCDE
jgi:hypothetical protein